MSSQSARKYAIVFPVHARTEKIFSKDEIETAAKVSLVEKLPVGCNLSDEPQWDVQWSLPHLEPAMAKTLLVAAEVSM